MPSPTAPVVLVDGSSYLYRAFHAMPPLTNAKGQPTGAVRGVISMLRRLAKDYPESPIAVVFDAKGKTFRDELYSQYKAHRPPMPDELRDQVEPIHGIIRAMGLPLLIVDGVEADDVIGTLAREATEQQRDVVISTGDKDMAQLISDHVTLVNTMTETTLDEAGVRAKFGFGPAQVVDYLALVGDKVDNIPGVPGVGEKTALALLQNMGSLQGIYENIDRVSTLDFRGAKAMPQKLLEFREQAFISYELATIKTDVPLELALAELLPAPAQNTELLEWFRAMEFKGWVTELEAELAATMEAGAEAVTPAAIDNEKNYQTLLSTTELDRWLAKLEQAGLFAFNIKTTSSDYMDARLVGVALAVVAGEAAYIPLGHGYLGAPVQLDGDYVLNRLKPLLENPEYKKVGQNLKYGASVLANHGITLRGIAYDTMLESYVLNSTSSRHDLDILAMTHLGVSTIQLEDIAGKGAKQLNFSEIRLEEAAPYAAEAADIALQLHQALWPRLAEEGRLPEVFREIEMPLVPVLSRIERNGVLINRQALADQSYELGKRLQALQEQAYELAGEEFNLGSTQQLAHILFNKLELPVLKKTPKGAPSTAEEVLQELALDYPLPRILMEYRGLSKLKSTYTDKLPLMINAATGRVHTSYHQAVTATGRLSSSDPNLQNIPIRTEEGRRIRQAFIAPKGYKLLAADYSQIELRIMAHLSGDESLRYAFAEGLDVHRATAAEVFDLELDQVTDEQRRSAKAINFGLIYGMSAFGLAKQLHLGRQQAQEYIERYFERYPTVQNYMNNIRTMAAQRGFVETLSGRRLYLPEINARNGMRRQAAERTAINAPMQGTAADIIKKAMLSIDDWLTKSGKDARIVMQVHDELVLEVAEDQLEEVKRKACELMSSAMELSVPLLVESGVGDNWDQAH